MHNGRLGLIFCGVNMFGILVVCENYVSDVCG